EQGGHDTQLAEAMVRRDMEYKIGDTVISEKGELLTLTNEEAAQLVGEEGEPKRHLLSEGTVKNVDELLEAIGLSGAEKKELEITGAEKIARFISALAPVLLMIGLAGIYIEFKTPGFGLPGIVGGTALLLFFWGHHIAGLSGMEDMIIFLAGVSLLLIEILLIPGFGFTGIAGILLIMWSLVSAMTQHYPGMPWYQPSWDDLSQAFVSFAISLAGTVGIGVLAGHYLPKTRAFNRLMLSKEERREDGFSATHDLSYLVGRTGTTLCALRPAGSVRFGEDRYDVVTQGEYIAQDRPVTVIEAHGGRLIVKEPSNRKDTEA
ncbi:MAG: hypothetical protein EOM20_10775, partial [Spartobacteria bacterium]|nr:hypothetical protein [Spartobacteria bacterium]